VHPHLFGRFRIALIWGVLLCKIYLMAKNIVDSAGNGKTVAGPPILIQVSVARHHHYRSPLLALFTDR
jgi:hypothetical protein